MADLAAIGVVYYGDDPDKKVFRTVFQEDGDPLDELVDPKWTTEACDVTRNPILEAFQPNDPNIPAMIGTPSAPPTTGGLTLGGDPWPPIDSGE